MAKDVIWQKDPNTIEGLTLSFVNGQTKSKLDGELSSFELDGRMLII
jgi:hypothetical protein